MSTNYKTNYMNQNFCPIHGVTQLLGGKWKMPLMFVIQGGPMRFGQLKRALKSYYGANAYKTIKRVRKT